MEAERRLPLFSSDRQMQARLMPMAAGAQLLLGVAYLDSLYLVKSRLAEEDRLLQVREGLPDPSSSWLDHFAWYG